MSYWLYLLLSYAVLSVGILGSFVTCLAATKELELLLRGNCTLLGLSKLLTCWLLIGVQLFVVLLVPLWLSEVLEVVFPYRG